MMSTSNLQDQTQILLFVPGIGQISTLVCSTDNIGHASNHLVGILVSEVDARSITNTLGKDSRFYSVGSGVAELA